MCRNFTNCNNSAWSVVTLFYVCRVYPQVSDAQCSARLWKWENIAGLRWLNVMCSVADNLLSLALDTSSQCTGRLLTRDIGRNDRVRCIIQTLMMNGAVLVPYPCCRADKRRLALCELCSGIVTSLRQFFSPSFGCSHCIILVRCLWFIALWTVNFSTDHWLIDWLGWLAGLAGWLDLCFIAATRV